MSAPSTSSQGSSQGHFLVAASASAVYVRVEGLATMTSCAPLQSFLEDSRIARADHVVFDLAHCRGFDSTFMGTIVSVASPARRPPPARAAERVILVNVSDAHRSLLASVGVDRIISVCDAPGRFPDVPLRRLDAARASLETRLRRVVRAHERLLEIDPANEEKFGAFVTLVRKELAARSDRGGQARSRGGGRPRDRKE